MFNPISPPPTEHHNFASGLSTEFGDNAKTVAEKINAGFKHVYSVLSGMGASLADEIEYVAKSEFDALVHELDEVKAEFANLKMMVQGLGFAGARPQPNFRVIPEAVGTQVESLSGGGTVTVTGEPVVTVKEVTEQ